MPVKFYLHPKVNKNGEAPITISINIRQTRLLTTLGYSVDPAVWEKSAQVKPRYTNSKGVTSRKINNRIMKRARQECRALCGDSRSRTRIF